MDQLAPLRAKTGWKWSNCAGLWGLKHFSGQTWLAPSVHYGLGASEKVINIGRTPRSAAWHVRTFPWLLKRLEVRVAVGVLAMLVLECTVNLGYKDLRYKNTRLLGHPKACPCQSCSCYPRLLIRTLAYKDTKMLVPAVFLYPRFTVLCWVFFIYL
jgi:hypothetical protein